jgi:hypothetical protein
VYKSFRPATSDYSKETCCTWITKLFYAYHLKKEATKCMIK